MVDATLADLPFVDLAATVGCDPLAEADFPAVAFAADFTAGVPALRTTGSDEALPRLPVAACAGVPVGGPSEDLLACVRDGVRDDDADFDACLDIRSAP